MKVDISQLEELEPFFTHLATNGIMYSPENSTEHQEFIRGAVYPDGRMDLCKQVVGPTWIGALMTALKTNTQVEHFLLGNNITNLEGGRAIGEFLAAPRPNKIKTWYLAGSEFSSKALEHIISGFLAAGDNDVSGLWLKRNPLYAEGMRHIRKLLESNKSLKVLDLHNTAIGLKEQAYSDETNNFERHTTDNGIKELCEGLKVNEILENLYLGANALTQSSINYLADYFQFKVNHYRPGIKSLWLDMNKLTDEGCKVLCESLVNYPIRVLELGSNFISEDGMAHIARCFRNHSTLEVLHLGLYKATADMGVTTNNIGDSGVPAICELIENNTSIRHLDISMNNISNEGMSLITASLEKNTTLWYMNYKQYGHNTEQKNVQKIADLLERNREPYCPEIEFDKNHERRFIHGDNIWTIDSIYRNSMK
jgi:Ran GTPase-activating protein (RanGAP) involved in mRNA processing and transport